MSLSDGKSWFWGGIEGGEAAELARLQAIMDAPSAVAFRRKKFAHEREVAARGDALQPRQHPFKYDPKKPTLHP